MSNQQGKLVFIDLSFLQQSNCYPNQQLIVQKPSKSGETTSKKPRNEELPSWIEPQWFCHTFVTMYMEFVGQTTDPWDVPVKQSVKVMQKIWDETNSYQYEITKCIKFAKYYLEDLRFLYKDTEHDNKKVWF